MPPSSSPPPAVPHPNPPKLPWHFPLTSSNPCPCLFSRATSDRGACRAGHAREIWREYGGYGDPAGCATNQIAFLPTTSPPKHFLFSTYTHANLLPSHGCPPRACTQTGKLEDNTFVVMDTFALPVEGTETRVTALDEGYEYMVWIIPHPRPFSRRPR